MRPSPADLARPSHDRPAPPPGAPGRVDGTLPGRPHPADRAPRARPRRRRHPRPRAAHRGGDAAGRGAGAGPDLHQLPPGTQPEPLVGPRRRRASAASLARRLRPGRAGGGRHRRDDRAPLGRQDRGARHLPRPGALQPRPPRQGQRPALDHGDAPRPDPLGRPGLGPAVPGRAGAFGAFRARARTSPQEADRPGAPTPPPGRPLAARAPRGRSRRQQLRRHRAARGGLPPPHRGHPAQARRPAVRPAPAAPAGHPRPAAPVGRAPAHPGRAPGRPGYPLAAGHGRGWYGRTERRIELVSGTALWHHPGKRVPVLWLLVRDVAGEFEPQGFVCTDPDADPLDVLRWFVRRWSVEGTFAQGRRHLGVESQRQWADPAIARTTPALLGLFSLVTLWAGATRGGVRPRSAAWYPKPRPTFSDALAAVRYRLWTSTTFSTSRSRGEVAEIPP